MINNEENSMPLSDDKNAIRFGLSVVITVFVVFGLWAAFAPLSSSSVASAVVSAGTNKKIVQHLEGGIVNKIFIKNGDFVKKGDILISLDGTEFKADLKALEAKYFTLIAVDARLDAYKNELKYIVFPKNLKDEKIMIEQNNIFNSKMKLREDKKLASEKQILQVRKQAKSYESNKATTTRYLQSITEEISELESFLKDGLIDKIKYRELLRSKDETLGELERLVLGISEKNIQISALKTDEIIQEKEFKNKTLEEIVETKKSLSDTISKLTIVKDRFIRSKVIAPKDGLVTNFNYSTIGEVVNPRDTILEIIPNDIKLNLLARVPVTDIDKVKFGLEADVIFSAFNLKNVDIIQGKVTTISADSLLDEATGESYYEAIVEVTKKGLITLKDNELVLVSGMPAQVIIKIEGRTVLQYFLKPFTLMLARSFNEE